MNQDIYQKLKEIKLENFAFLLLITSGIIDLLANEKIKKSYTRANGKEDARKKFILASCLILIVFGYFSYRNYNKLKTLIPGSEEYQIAYVRFIGSIFIVAGELLVLYYFINTPELRDDGF